MIAPWVCEVKEALSICIEVDNDVCHLNLYHPRPAVGPWNKVIKILQQR